MPAVILYESFLIYLGMGVQPPMASWGTLIAEGVGQINSVRIYWWLVLFPGGILVTTLLAMNFIGDGLATPGILNSITWPFRLSSHAL